MSPGEHTTPLISDSMAISERFCTTSCLVFALKYFKSSLLWLVNNVTPIRLSFGFIESLASLAAIIISLPPNKCTFNIQTPSLYASKQALWTVVGIS